jgi:small GTP-binding protein
MSKVNRENKRNRRKKAKQRRNEKEYFSNEISINEFSQKMINDLASLKKIKEQLKEISMPYEEIETMENEAFNLLINKIELEKGNSKVEVGVIGSFSSGKSTFINSLFGESICPMDVKPSTSSITKFYYGDKKKITINGHKITQEEYENCSKHLKRDTQTIETNHIETNYIEYAYPFERLSSIILYDTPGFNNNDTDTETTMKTLNSVDVIFFVIDISKGAIDKSSIDRLQLPEFKNKRMYCILNKSDLKSPKAIKKIKDEIINVNEKLFTEVIEYSASKVLEFGEKNYITDSFKKIDEQYIHTKSDFNIHIKGTRTETKGRIKTKIEYKLYIDEREYLIDDFYIRSKKQKARVEKLLNLISESKQDTLSQTLKIDMHHYRQKSRFIIEEKLQELSILNHSQRNFSTFNKDIETFKQKLFKFEKEHITHFYQEWNYFFMRSCSIRESSDKSFWSTTYYKIYFDTSTFKTQLREMEFTQYMKEFIEKWIHFFKDNYDFQLHYHHTSAQLRIISEALSDYSPFYNKAHYLIEDSIEKKFQTKDEVRNYLVNKKAKDKISQLHYFLQENQGNIENKKRELYGQDSIKIKNIKNLKMELNNFIKEKEDYVNRLQK